MSDNPTSGQIPTHRFESSPAPQIAGCAIRCSPFIRAFTSPLTSGSPQCASVGVRTAGVGVEARVLGAAAVMTVFGSITVRFVDPLVDASSFEEGSRFGENSTKRPGGSSEPGSFHAAVQGAERKCGRPKTMDSRSPPSRGQAAQKGPHWRLSVLPAQAGIHKPFPGRIEPRVQLEPEREMALARSGRRCCSESASDMLEPRNR